jgi:hypothetical protein
MTSGLDGTCISQWQRALILIFFPQSVCLKHQKNDEKTAQLLD